MNELNALQTGRWFPHDVTGASEAKLYNDRVKGVADGLTVYSNVNENGLTVNSLSELPKIVSDYIFARIFYVNEQDQINGDIVRAYNFENMDDFALEYDEAANADTNGQIPVARTKKINSFGIKRVMYPELRVLKHITYTVGESVLYQFKYNNWRENQGFVNEERNRDYRRDYLNEDNLSMWKMDEQHLTLELKILDADSDYPRFDDYWHDKAIAYAEEAKKASCPLNELDNILADFYTTHFREDGVEAFYASKERVIQEMAKEIRRNVEKGLFDKWRLGDVSIVELQKVSKLLIERLGEIRIELETKSKEEKDNYEACDEDRMANVDEWSRLGVLQRMVGNGARRYAEHQSILTDYYTAKTRLVALEFAKKLAASVFVQIEKMDADISAFGQKINEAIEETERLVAAQRKINKGLEDMKGAIIEVSEDETMRQFELDVKIDKIDMPSIARQIRDIILPQGDFTNFGNLANEISVDDIKDAFDVKLSEVVKTKHDEKAASEKKVLGLNILTQLQQKLKTDDDIKAFASKIVSQSGMFLKLNNDQCQLHLRNNEGNLSPTNPASINKKAILVSIPSPDGNDSLKRFADKLEDAFKNSFNQSTARTTITINRKSPKKDELSIITVGYCFPMRAIDWMSSYKEKYERFLNTGNPNTDAGNAILLHSENDGSHCPSLFAVENAEEIAAQKAREAQMAAQAQMGYAQTQAMQQPYGQQPQMMSAQPQPMAPQPMGAAPTPPPMPGAAVPPPMQPAEPQVQMFLYIGGQQYGPYDYKTLKQFVPTGQLTQQTMVWQQGMAAWTPAGQVPELQALFAPQMTPAMPGVPPTPQMPPMPPTM